MVRVVGEAIGLTVTVGGKSKGRPPSADNVIVMTFAAVGDVFPTNEVSIPEGIGDPSGNPVVMEACCPLVGKKGLESRSAEAWG